jgi:hypothetical protein
MTATPEEIDGELSGIAFMVEVASRSIGQMRGDGNGIFHIPHEEINLLDFAIVDLDRRVKALRERL